MSKVRTRYQDDEPRPGILYARRDELHRVAQLIREEGQVMLHCPDWSCGQMTVLPVEQSAWVCPIHGGQGVEP